MMLIDFLNDCKVCIPEEKHDFDTVKRALKDKAYINYLPAVWDDLYPVHIMDMMAGKHNFTNAYLCPVGASDFFGLHHFNEILNDFYENDIIKPSPLYYGAELEEAILLKSTTIHVEREFKIAGFSPNVIYIRIATHRGNKAHLFLIADTPENSFKEIIEDFEVKIHVTVENHKGLGSHFDGFELYRLFAESNKHYLLPKYWFFGKYAWPINMPLNSVYKASKCEIYEVPNWSEYTKKKSRRKDNNENE